MTLAFLFPGQGSQTVGMGGSLAGAFASAREVFDEVDEALGKGVSQLAAALRPLESLSDTVEDLAAALSAQKAEAAE